MGELLEYFKEKYSKKNNSETKSIMEKQKVKNSILRLCDKYLQESGDIFTFEVLPQQLPYAVEVVTEEPLTTQYCINQVSETIFIARLRDFEIG